MLGAWKNFGILVILCLRIYCCCCVMFSASYTYTCQVTETWLQMVTVFVLLCECNFCARLYRTCLVVVFHDARTAQCMST